MNSYQNQQSYPTINTSQGRQNATVCNKITEISEKVTAEIRSHCAPQQKFETPEEDSENREQLRTKVNKRLVLDIFATNGCNVTKVCQKVGIDRATFYRWLERDVEFAEGIRQAEVTLNDMVEDKLMMKIFHLDHGPSIRFYLKHKHPDYMPPSRLMYNKNRFNYHRTAEDILDEIKNRIEKSETKF